MPLLQRVILYTVDLLIVGLITGLVVRRRYSACYSFFVQTIAVLASDLLLVFWPDRFYTKKFWLVKESFLHLLTLAVALELTFRVFRAFPGASWTARRVLIAILGLTALLAVQALPWGQSDPTSTLAEQVFPRVLNGAVWLFAGIAALILWYRLPVDPLHKAILIGSIPYLMLFTVVLNWLHTFGWEQLAEKLSYLESSAYLLVAAYWTYAAWHPSRVPAQAPERATYAVERPT